MREQGLRPEAPLRIRNPESGISELFIWCRYSIRHIRPNPSCKSTTMRHIELKIPGWLLLWAGLLLVAERSRRTKKPAFLFVNNRLEGHAPSTIEAVVRRLTP